MDIISVYRIIDLTGVFINGILGGAIARRRKFDAIGFGLLAILSGLGGGMIRDITIGVVPAIFGGNTLYATSALLGSGMMVHFNSFQLQTVGMVVSASFASILSIVAYFKGWGLPNNPDWAPVTMTAGQLRRLMLTRAMVEHDERLARKQRRKLRRRKDDGGSHSSI